MPYNTKKLKQKALESIDKHKLFFIEDIVAMLGIAKQTFYDHFPIGSDDSDDIKKALEKNRVQIKASLRSKWYNSDNPATQIALYKIIASEDEAHRLNGSSKKIDHTTNGQPIPASPTEIVFYIPEDENE